VRLRWRDLALVQVYGIVYSPSARLDRLGD